MLDGRQYQNAYVTRNVDRGVAALAALYGIDFQRIEAPFPVRTADGPATMTLKLALGWHEGVQIELIEPVDGHVDLYRALLPASDGLAFHHHCTRVADWDQLLDDIARQGLPVAFSGGGESLKFIYVDARDRLGHFLEYTWMTDARWQSLGGPA